MCIRVCVLVCLDIGHYVVLLEVFILVGIYRCECLQIPGSVPFSDFCMFLHLCNIYVLHIFAFM